MHFTFIIKFLLMIGKCDFFLSKGAFSRLASWLINDYKVQSKPGHFSSGDKCFSNCSFIDYSNTILKASVLLGFYRLTIS